MLSEQYLRTDARNFADGDSSPVPTSTAPVAWTNARETLTAPKQKSVYVYPVFGDFYGSTLCNREAREVRVNVKYVTVNEFAGTRRESTERWECRKVDQLPATDPIAAASPAVAEEPLIRDEVTKHLPRPKVSVNPDPRGLTGLEARFWHEDDTQAQWQLVDHDRNPATPAIAALIITAKAGGYSITAQAWPTDYRWEIQPKTQPGTRPGRDRATLTSRQAGSRDEPAARYVFQTKGLYSITEATAWTGTYTWQAPGRQGTGQLGSVLLDTSRDYPVIEVRGVLKP